MALRKNLSEIDPSLIELDSETKYVQSHSRTARRVKLNRGESWLIRFLPAALGPKRLWFARIAKHWHNKQPITCPVHTSPEYGGDPDAYCEVCETAALLNEDSNDAISKIGYNAIANAQWLTYCIVLQKSTGSSTVDMSEAESMQVHEFQHYKGTWEELSQFYRNNIRPGNPKSVLDYVQGCDFWVSRTGNGTRLDKQDPQPIFEGLVEPASDPRIRKLEEQMRTPKVQIPSAEDLHRYAKKLNDDAVLGSRSRNTSARSEEFENDENRRGDTALDGNDERPARPVRPTRPTRAAAPAPAPAEDDQVPGAEMPARTRATAPAPAPEPEPEPEGAPEVEADGGTEMPQARPAARPAPTPRAAPTPLATRAAPAPARANPPAPAARAQTVPPPPPRTRTERVDDAEDLPEERHDPAPPAEEALPSSNVQPPPPVARSANNATTAAGIRSRIASVSQRQS